MNNDVAECDLAVAQLSDALAHGNDALVHARLHSAALAHASPATLQPLFTRACVSTCSGVTVAATLRRLVALRVEPATRNVLPLAVARSDAEPLAVLLAQPNVAVTTALLAEAVRRLMSAVYVRERPQLGDPRGGDVATIVAKVEMLLDQLSAAECMRGCQYIAFSVDSGALAALAPMLFARMTLATLTNREPHRISALFHILGFADFDTVNLLLDRFGAELRTYKEMGVSIVGLAHRRTNVSALEALVMRGFPLYRLDKNGKPWIPFRVQYRQHRLVPLFQRYELRRKKAILIETVMGLVGTGLPVLPLLAIAEMRIANEDEFEEIEIELEATTMWNIARKVHLASQ